MKRMIQKLFPLSAIFLFAACSDSGETDFYNDNKTNFYFEAASEEINLEASQKSALFDVACNLWWKAEITYPQADTEPWCWLEKDEGMGDVTLRLTSEVNIDAEERTAILTLMSDDGGQRISRDFTITQQASDPFFALVREQVEMSVIRGDSALVFSTNSQWTAEVIPADNGWFSLEKKAGSKGLDQRVGFTCEKNTTGELRHITVILKSPADETLKAEFTVSQRNAVAAPKITLTDDNQLTLSWTTDDTAVLDYTVSLAKADGTSLKVLTTDKTELQLADLNGPKLDEFRDYVGPVKAVVRANTEEPELFAESDEILLHSRFNAGSDSGANVGVYLISAPRHFLNIRDRLDGNYRQIADLDFANIAFAQIGNATEAFMGTYDGSNSGSTWSIANAQIINADNTTAGLFGRIEGARISNLKISGISVTLKGISTNTADLPNIGTGALVGINDGGTVSGISAENCTLSATNTSYGHVVGNNRNGGIVENCTTSGGSVLISSGGWGGGVVGANLDASVVRECSNLGTPVNVRNTAGGVIGMNEGLIEGCYNTAGVTCNVNAGGITGGATRTAPAGTSPVIRNCGNIGTVSKDSGTACYVGGIVGQMKCPADGAGQIEECWNTGNFSLSGTDKLDVGGIAGQITYATITNCYAKGEIKTVKAGANNLFGGIVGNIENFVGTGVAYCYSLMTYAGTNNNSKIGGIAGWKRGESPFMTSNYFLEGTADTAATGNTTSNYTDNVSKSDDALKSLGTFASWPDFGTVWQISATVNNGYPSLKETPIP